MRLTGVIAIAMMAASAVVAAVPAQANTSRGELRCRIAGGFGLAVVGQRATTCVYYRADGGVEFYTGSIGRIGVDLGPTDARRLTFRVAVPQPEAPGALEGRFAGVGFGVTLGTGISADTLVGGRDRRAALTPAAYNSFTSTNINGGIGTLDLHYEGAEGAVERRY